MKLKRICAVAAILILIFIWGNSFFPKSVSSDLSIWVMSLISKVVTGDLSAQGSVSDAGVLRKVAHFTEFFAFGTAISVYVRMTVSDKRTRILALSLLGMLVALFDETIQIFSGRGPQVSDIWIDIAGYTLGVLVVAAVVTLRRKKREKSEKNNSNKT